MFGSRKKTPKPGMLENDYCELISAYALTCTEAYITKFFREQEKNENLLFMETFAFLFHMTRAGLMQKAPQSVNAFTDSCVRTFQKTGVAEFMIDRDSCYGDIRRGKYQPLGMWCGMAPPSPEADVLLSLLTMYGDFLIYIQRSPQEIFFYGEGLPVVLGDLMDVSHSFSEMKSYLTGVAGAVTKCLDGVTTLLEERR